ncbi:hypothetical protein GCM10009557_92910 [Virgisporangium ochraceum]
MTDRKALRAALRAVATPDLYRDHMFRSADSPTDVTPAGTGRPRPGAATRAVAEFFWFWDGPGADDGLAAYRAGDPARADAAWEAAGTDVAHHNLAVLNHLLALDLDHEVRVGAAQWRRAYRFWLRVWRSDPFWDAYAARADATEVIREELRLVRAPDGASGSVRWAVRRQSDAMVEAHWQLVEYDGFPDDVRATARRAAANAVIARIGDRVDQANDAIRRTPEKLASIARSLHDAVLPAVETLRLGPPDRHTAVRDAVAVQLLKYAVFYHEWTGDWGESLTLVYLARTLGTYRVGAKIAAYADELERERDADQRRVGVWDREFGAGRHDVGPGHRVRRLPSFHRPVPDLRDLRWSRDLS